jgi:hypothetical protein
MNERDDLAMMRDPDRWPVWPQLPIKRNKDGAPLELGRLLNTSLKDDTVAPIVRLGTIFEPWSNAETIEYPDLEAVVADGWIVD